MCGIANAVLLLGLLGDIGARSHAAPARSPLAALSAERARVIEDGQPDGRTDRCSRQAGHRRLVATSTAREHCEEVEGADQSTAMRFERLDPRVRATGDVIPKSILDMGRIPSGCPLPTVAPDHDPATERDRRMHDVHSKEHVRTDGSVGANARVGPLSNHARDCRASR